MRPRPWRGGTGAGRSSTEIISSLPGQRTVPIGVCISHICSTHWGVQLPFNPGPAEKKIPV